MTNNETRADSFDPLLTFIEVHYVVAEQDGCANSVEPPTHEYAL
jgi:hypothetical protein